MSPAGKGVGTAGQRTGLHAFDPSGERRGEPRTVASDVFPAHLATLDVLAGVVDRSLGASHLLAPGLRAKPDTFAARRRLTRFPARFAAVDVLIPASLPPAHHRASARRTE
ncbi:MAG: hypothetical protein M3501_10685 [Actinomycetota bacterium]|nr:hypothetical protein [Actinomycetota bacterium]MDQ3405623.1 hypothetical protein [Actinomycetota bacterium]